MPAKTAAERKAAQRERQNDQGLVRVEVLVPAYQKEAVKHMAQAMRDVEANRSKPASQRP